MTNLIKIAQSEPQVIIEQIGDQGLVLPDNQVLVDYSWFSPMHEEHWLVERKALPDLLTSISSGHLANQLIDACQSGDNNVGILLIEDFPSLDMEWRLEYWYWGSDGRGGKRLKSTPTKWKWPDLVDFLLSGYIHLGIVPVWSPHISCTGKMIAALHRWSLKEDRGSWLKRKPKPLSFFVDPRVDILSRFPGIGEHQAIELLKTHGTIREVLNRSAIELEKGTKGIGKKRAADIESLSTWEWDVRDES
jgi:ERCC4-type nuclease